MAQLKLYPFFYAVPSWRRMRREAMAPSFGRAFLETYASLSGAPSILEGSNDCVCQSGYGGFGRFSVGWEAEAA